MPTRILCSTIAKRHQPWRDLVSLGCVDVVLVQEAGRVAPEVADQVWLGPEEHYDSHHWHTRWCEGLYPRLLERWPMVVRLSDRVELEWFKQVSPISFVAEDELAVSGIGTITAARVVPKEEPIEPFIAVSMYARWMSPHPSTRSKWRVGYSDGSAHWILSNLSAIIGDVDPASHRITRRGHDQGLPHQFADIRHGGDLRGLLGPRRTWARTSQ